LDRGGVEAANVEATTGERHVLQRPDDFWEIVLGSGFRGTVDAMSQEQRGMLRERVQDELRSREVLALHNDVVFATAVKG
jgi:hypothetical protein